MPRFRAENLAANQALADFVRAEAERKGTTPALVEDWLRERGLANPAPQPRKEQSAMTDTALSPLDTALARIGGGGAGGEQDGG